jgi:hypothetical protein
MFEIQTASCDEAGEKELLKKNELNDTKCHISLKKDFEQTACTGACT